MHGGREPSMHAIDRFVIADFDSAVDFDWAADCFGRFDLVTYL